MIYESSDLIYHLLVLLAHHGIKLEEVEAEIARRFGQSGLDEKAARTVDDGQIADRWQELTTKTRRTPREVGSPAIDCQWRTLPVASLLLRVLCVFVVSSLPAS